MRRIYAAVILAMLGVHAGTAVAGGDSFLSEDNVLLAGDVLTVLAPIATFGIAFFKKDTEGEKQWLRSTLINEVLNTGLRGAFNQTHFGERPNGGQYGFPSGHAGFVFSQAAFLQERYGWRYGAPALGLASVVSYIRVREDKHHWRDVIAGGALAYGVALITVTPANATHVAPVVGPDWLGIRFERSF